MTGAPTEATVLDTSALSNFAHVDRLDLLADSPESSLSSPSSGSSNPASKRIRTSERPSWPST